MDNTNTKDIVALLVTLFVPPLGVALKKGFGGHFWVNLALTIFGFYIAGLIHGIFVVLKD
jgi:uncharacterized membrane protein YqaE (UPF0057 family)